MTEPPVIVALISDLFFSVQVENSARTLGYRVARIERGADLEPADEAPAERERPGAFVFVGAGNVARGIVAPHHSPAFDIDEDALPIGTELLARLALEPDAA